MLFKIIAGIAIVVFVVSFMGPQAKIALECATSGKKVFVGVIVLSLLATQTLLAHLASGIFS